MISRRKEAAPAAGSARRRLFEVLSKVPPARVTSFDCLASYLNSAVTEVAGLLARMSDDERQLYPWHRVVAKGGAIGRGPWRERQFALLIREGVPVSPAGIVQDLTRYMLTDLSRPAPVGYSPDTPGAAAPERPASRSRGFKDRPGT